MTLRFAARVLPIGLLVAALTGGPTPAYAGAYSFTVEPIDPLTQSTPDLFVGIYFDFLLTNTSSQPDSFHLVVDNITNIDFYGQVCIGATCFPLPTTIFVDALATEIIGVNLAPFADGSSDADFHVTSIGDAGLVYDETVTLYAGTAATGVQELLAAASPLSLAQNVPNPVRGDTRIAYALSSDVSVRLRVFDVSGRAVRTLAEGVRSRGIHDATWDGLDERGLPLASGVYFYRLESSNGSLTKQLTLIR
jgi:hypothetical protein